MGLIWDLKNKKERSPIVRKREGLVRDIRIEVLLLPGEILKQKKRKKANKRFFIWDNT